MKGYGGSGIEGEGCGERARIETMAETIVTAEAKEMAETEKVAEAKHSRAELPDASEAELGTLDSLHNEVPQARRKQSAPQALHRWMANHDACRIAADARATSAEQIRQSASEDTLESGDG